MGSTSYITKPKSAGFRVKSGSSAGSDKDMNGKLRRTKIRRPVKMTDYGLKRVPDYTELAYKEAVSKLRYFLSGNYAPSVRSYGGSASIKNLDESDGDLDKKYTTSASYNNLPEFKPRPRLTAKYTTLYADSLHNYNPTQHITTPAPPPATTAPAPAADLTGGTNPDVINFIQKQEEYIEQLERESQYCRDELNNLLGKVKEVISENEHLHEAQKNKLISRMFHSYNAGSETDDLDDVGDSTGLDSDNKATPSKSRKGAKSRSSRLEGPNIVFESRIAELEAQLAQSKIDLKKVQDENNENKRKLASGLVDSTCLDGFKRQIDNLQRDKSALEVQISKLKLNLEQRDEDGKYKRGSDVVEQQLRDERNNLEAEIRRLKDDLGKERNKVRELAGEGARRAIQERSAAEQRYNAHFDELQHDLAAQYDNVAKLQLDLERQRREENDLKRELSMKNSAIEELKNELKNKTASLQADLAQAHAEKASLDEELASARLAIERHQRQSKHETNRLNSEIQSLRQRLDRADADLVHSRRENLRLSEQISNLEKELNMKTLTPMSPEKKNKEKELSTMLESMENKHAKTVAGLETMIQSQNSLMEKLTGECRLLTDKLDDANRRHKQSAESRPCRRTNQNTARPFKIPRPSGWESPFFQAPLRKRVREELATLQRQVETLGRSMQPIHTPTPSTYQAPPTHTSTTRNISHTPSDAGRDYTRAEPAGDTKHGDQPEPRVRSDQLPRDDQFTPRPVKQDSRTSLYSQPENKESPENQANDDVKGQLEEYQTEVVSKEEMEEEPKFATEYKEEIEKPKETEDIQEYAAQDYEPVDQSYEQTQPTEETEYQTQNQEHEQNYEQPAYTEGQYENYEQYPQQYTDPNAQYEGQYENYTTDTNYQNQNYDNTQFNQEYTEQDTVQYQENQPAEIPQEIESKTSNSPNHKVPSQS